jgi:HAD superfamily hydrolase (TIGR01509 family)
MSQIRGALLFDIDGTLCDTDPLHIRAFNAMLARFGRSIEEEEYARRVMGFANADIMRDFFPELPVEEHRALAEHKEAAFRDLARTELRPTAGLLDLLDWADGQGLPMAAVTNAPKANADLMLAGLGVEHRFRAIVIGDTLPRGKPDPLPYRVSAERLGVDCAHCVAFEDSRSGLRSASGAGAFAIGMMSSLPEPELVASGARFGVRDFNDPRLRDIILKQVSG